MPIYQIQKIDQKGGVRQGARLCQENCSFTPTFQSEQGVYSEIAKQALPLQWKIGM